MQLIITLFVLILSSTLVGCHDEPVYTSSILPAVSEPAIHEQTLPKLNGKKGNILQVESFTEAHNIKLWNRYMGERAAVYRFKPGEEVLVYHKAGEYVYLSPAADTSIAGYILAGWIEFDHDNKVNNDQLMLAIPQLKPIVNGGEPKPVAPPALISMEKLLRKTTSHIVRDPVRLDEKHMLQDEVVPNVRADTLKLYFEKND
jgi:hypothetical protein